MAEPIRICPGCEQPMQLFYAKDVELERCGRCGGLWFNWGELEAVTGRDLEPEPLDGETSRRCAYCRITLVPALLPGGVPVETCTACRGLYLDAGELTELGVDEPPAPEPRLAVPQVSFGPNQVEGGRAPLAPRPPRVASPEVDEPKYELAELKAEEAEKAKRRAKEERAASLQPLSAFDSFACVKCGQRFPFRQGNAMASGLACPTCAPSPSRRPPRGSLQRGAEDLFDFLKNLKPRRRGNRRPW